MDSGRDVLGGKHDRATAYALLALAVAVYVGLCLHANFLADDAFISFRYARNLVRGLGLVFNPGERVEGYTNFLLVLVLAGLNRLGLDIVTAGRMLSGLGGVACVVLTAVVTRRTLGGPWWLAVAAAALVAVNPYVAAWGGAGLETTLFAALLLASVLPLASGRITPGRFLLSSGTALLLALTRPEGVLVYAAILGTVFATLHGAPLARIRLVAPGVGLFGAAGGVYFAWRWHYFGALLPNTYAAKSGFTFEHFADGLLYIWRFFASPFNVVAAPLVVFGAGALRRRGKHLPVLVLTVLLAAILLEGGDGLPMYRFLIPAVPLLALCTVAGAVAFTTAAGTERTRPLRQAVLPAILVLSFFPARDLQYGLFLNQRDHEIPQWRAAGKALGRALPSDALIAAEPIGAIGWYSDLRILDMLGLTDATIARAPLDPSIVLAGHQKHDGRYVIGRRPDVLLLGNVLVNRSPALSDMRPFFADADVSKRERDIFEQPAFRFEYSLASIPLGDGTYLHLFVRNDRRHVLPRR